MKITHLARGIVVLRLFAVTGHYMKYHLNQPATEFTAQRMMFRASHIYLLFAGTVNTLVGCYWVCVKSKPLRVT